MYFSGARNFSYISSSWPRAQALTKVAAPAGRPTFPRNWRSVSTHPNNLLSRGVVSRGAEMSERLRSLRRTSRSFRGFLWEGPHPTADRLRRFSSSRGSNRVRAEGVRNLMDRVGWGRVGSVGSGRVGSGQEVFKYHESVWVTLAQPDPRGATKAAKSPVFRRRALATADPWRQAWRPRRGYALAKKPREKAVGGGRYPKLQKTNGSYPRAKM